MRKNASVYSHVVSVSDLPAVLVAFSPQLANLRFEVVVYYAFKDGNNRGQPLQAGARLCFPDCPGDLVPTEVDTHVIEDHLIVSTSLDLPSAQSPRQGTVGKCEGSGLHKPLGGVFM